MRDCVELEGRWRRFGLWILQNLIRAASSFYTQDRASIVLLVLLEQCIGQCAKPRRSGKEVLYEWHLPESALAMDRTSMFHA